jgi:hypothetical protein
MFNDELFTASYINLKVIRSRPFRIALALVPAIWYLLYLKPVIVPIETFWIFICFISGVAFYFYRDQIYCHEFNIVIRELLPFYKYTDYKGENGATV